MGLLTPLSDKAAVTEMLPPATGVPAAATVSRSKVSGPWLSKKKLALFLCLSFGFGMVVAAVFMTGMVYGVVVGAAASRPDVLLKLVSNLVSRSMVGGSPARAYPEVFAFAETFVRDPEMQAAVMPLIPEPYNTPQGFRSLVDSPEFSSILNEHVETALRDLNVTRKDTIDFLSLLGVTDGKNISRAFQEAGFNYTACSQTMAATPELQEGALDPKVYRALLDSALNPDNIDKYKDNAVVMKMVEIVRENVPLHGSSASLLQGTGNS